MGFASGLLESLQFRGSQVESEFTRGDRLEEVLGRHLLTVERNFDGELVTSILLLSLDGKRLSHGAAPSLPKSYCDALDGAEIGPAAGSCGTAAYLGRPVYVTDIATDPLWADYRHFALPHGFQSCWSTPIREPSGSVIGTFATYHRTVGGPTFEEIDAIDMITEHVAHAIMLARGVQDLQPALRHVAPRLRIVADNASDRKAPRQWPTSLLQNIERLEALAAELDQQAHSADTEKLKTLLRAAAADSRRLINTIRQY
jgi:GAF domain-containing protein